MGLKAKASVKCSITLKGVVEGCKSPTSSRAKSVPEKSLGTDFASGAHAVRCHHYRDFYGQKRF